MAIQIPTNPSSGQQFIAAGKLYAWNGTAWRRAYTYAIIDGGVSTTNVSGESETADGGNA